MSAPTDPDDNVVAAARALIPELRERGDEIEQARRLPKDLSDRLARAGFYRTLVPSVYGGLECSPRTVALMLETLALGDASAAWVTLVAATSGSALARVPPATARAVLATPETMICGVFAPRGRAERDRATVTASAAAGSGAPARKTPTGFSAARCSFATARLETDAAGSPRAHMALVPAAEVKFHDTWHVSGLNGTGSTDFEFDNVFVPEDRIVGYHDLTPPEGALQAFPHFGLLALCVGAVTLGIARAAIQELLELAGVKKPFGSRRTLAERAATQSDVAEAEALLRSGRAYFFEAIDAAWDAANRTGELTLEHRRDLRLATTHAVRSAARAVDLMYNLGGGSSVYRASRLQRHFRDIHVATQHIMVGPGTLEVAGRLLLGLETDTSQF
jgi:indole-3-acetate monooxygenase